MSEAGVLNPRNRGLGRGLDALFEIEETKSLSSNDFSKKMVGVEQLYPNPHQPRKYFDPETLNDLAASLKEYGVLQPLLVRPARNNKNAFEIIAGERRWRAAQIAQLHELPVIIQEMDDSLALQIGLVENLQREDLNAIEEALGYRNLMEEFGHTQQNVAKLVGKSRSQVTNMLRLLNLPGSIQEMVKSGALTSGHARALIGRPDAEDLAHEIIKQSLSVRDVEAMVQPLQDNRKQHSARSRSTEKDSDTQALEKELCDILGLNVSIQLKSRGGAMKIDFKTLDQLDYLVQKLTKN
jgi:ParB family chromosome partitioning protein